MLKQRPIEELKVKARLALTRPGLVWAAREASTPTAALEMAREDCDDASLLRACRFAAIIRRDYGPEAFDQAVYDANVAYDGTCDLTTEEGILVFGCLNAAHKQQVWDAWLKSARACDIVAFLRELYECVEEGRDYTRGGYQPYDQAAYDLVLARDPSSQDLLDLLEVGMMTGEADPFSFDDVVALLRSRRPSIEQCVAAIIEGNLFATTAWELLQEYDFAAGQLAEILDQIIAGTHTPDDLKVEAAQMLAQLTGESAAVVK